MAIILEKLLESSIASPPALYLKLQSAIKDSNTTYEEFADIISADPAFSARLLKIVNSSFYGFSPKLDSISHAVNIVGTDLLADLALAALVVEKFKGIPKDLVHMNSFWKHSIACGLVARTIAKHKKITDAESYYLGGLLHDIGSLLLYQEEPVKSRMILSEANLDKKNLSVVENKNFGFDHARVGGALLKKWQLPEMLIEAVSFHNNPFEAENYSLIAAMIHVADNIAHEMALGNNGEPLVPPLVLDVLKFIDLSQSDLDGFKDEIKQLFDETVELFLTS